MEKTPNRTPWILAILAVVGTAAWGGWWYHAEQVRKQAASEAEALFAPAIGAMAPPAVAEPVDIDKTVRVIHGMDRALESQGSLRDYLAYMAKQDFRGVAPDVLQARQKVLDVLMRLYAQQTELENQEATYTVTRTLLSALSLVEADVSWAAPGASLDREQAKSILDDLRRQQEERRELLDALTGLEVELLEVMSAYSETYYRHLAQWDALCLLRDRAYLAAHEGNWNAVVASARTATQKAPHDVEAHLLLAWGLIEGATSPEDPGVREGIEVLQNYLRAHPDRSAPALVLLGAAQAKLGDSKEAALNFQQAAAWYPRQSGLLTDMLDPYQARAFLRKSKEGKAIIDLYAATMVGAGAFSPDLHMARSHFRNGDQDSGRKKVLDHFSRRRNQEEWDLILDDLAFCSRELSPYFDQILIEDSHLFLEAKPALVGSTLQVRVRNQSARELRNATLLLAVRFTDMHREDFEVFKVGETRPTVAANETTDFGSLDVEFPWFGQTKGIDDIVLMRAILVTDDAVVWVDSDAVRFEQAAASPPQRETSTRTWFDALKISPEGLTELVRKNTRVDLELGLGRDDVAFTVPRELAWMDPVFRVAGDALVSPSTNTMGADGIRIAFEDLANFDEPQKPVTVRALSRYGTLEFKVDVSAKRVVDVSWLP